MANPGVTYFTQSCSISFSDFPEDVQLCILSFLSPSDLTTFSCTSKHFSSLYSADSKLWFALCDRRWGSYTEIKKWGNGHVGFMLLYRTLAEYEKLIGFWRRIGDAGINNSIAGSPPPHSQLVFFEWGASYVTGSTVSPSKDGGYNVIKSPFIWMSMSSDGEAVCYLDPNSRIGLQDQLPESPTRDLVHVNVSFMGKGHLFVEECRNLGGRGGNNHLSNSSSPDTRRLGYGFSRSGSIGLLADDLGGLDVDIVGGVEIGSPPDRLMSEMYQYFANRTSPGSSGDRAWRRQRKREKERRGRRRWEPEHLVRITGCSPSPSRPLQGLWKGITDDMILDFFLVTYDEMGGITCRRVGDSSKPFCGGPPVFWTSDATFTASPLSPHEEFIYNTRLHLRPDEAAMEEEGEASFLLYGGEEDPETTAVSKIMYINSSYDLVIPDPAAISVNPRHVEGRIWLYVDGSFGFGFLRNQFITDLKRVALDGRLLDSTEVGGAATGL